MARLLRFNKSHYDLEGLIRLHRGDDWLLNGSIVDRYEGLDHMVDLSDVESASAFFPGESGAVIARTLQISNAPLGQVRVSVPASGSVLAALSLGVPVGIYVGLTHAATADQPVETVDMFDNVLNIVDREFRVD